MLLSTPCSSKYRAAQQERGSVLLEAAIVLPLYMLLIGGIMWLGQLIYDKQKLVIADRYVAWNSGNRHNQGYPDVQTQFFGRQELDKVNSVNSGNWSQDRWWRLVYGSVGMVATVPKWTLGWLAVDAEMKGYRFTMADRTPTFFGRLDADNTKAGGHSILMRRDNDPGDTRDLTPGADADSLGINYDDITKEDYSAQ